MNGVPPPPLSAALDDLAAVQPVGVARGDACVATFLRAAVLASAERRGMVPPVSTWAEFRAATELLLEELHGKAVIQTPYRFAPRYEIEQAEALE